MKKLKRLAPYFVAGPLSGPLLAGVVINARGGRPILSGLYAIALVQYLWLLPVVAAKLSLGLS